MHTKHQPGKVLIPQVRLITQCREILTQVIEAKAVLRLLELGFAALLAKNSTTSFS
jgi:hypothetical protein